MQGFVRQCADEPVGACLPLSALPGIEGGLIGPITTAWRAVQRTPDGRVLCDSFVAATYETVKIFEPLGKAVSFVAADLRNNANILNANAATASGHPTLADRGDAPAHDALTLEWLCDAELSALAAPRAAAFANKVGSGTLHCSLRPWLYRTLYLSAAATAPSAPSAPGGDELLLSHVAVPLPAHARGAGCGAAAGHDGVGPVRVGGLLVAPRAFALASR